MSSLSPRPQKGFVAALAGPVEVSRCYLRDRGDACGPWKRAIRVVRVSDGFLQTIQRGVRDERTLSVQANASRLLGMPVVSSIATSAALR